MRALVLGGCGFIGSHVVDSLLARDHSVAVFDRSPERFRPPLRGVDYMFGDLSDRVALATALTGKDTVFHLVSTTFPGTANLDPQADVSGNLLGTLGLLETMNARGVGRLVYLSSGGTVYGRPEREPIPEEHPLRPINSYGIVKVAVEHYLSMFQTLHGLSSVAIRAANPFGPRQGHAGVQGAISTFLRRVRDREPIEIWGDGSVVRDYLYVADLSDLCVQAAGSEIAGALNAGSGVGRSLNEIVGAISRITGRRIDPVFRSARSVDVQRSVLDVSRANLTLGWTATTDFDAALAKTWDWIQKTD
ncbi:NAD-dependent epimerase/dehydratase family protein [Aminobacter anthyllidis]|uniref:NAD-dependent epimerase/dehydratase family protein n=1 Tax=Aminobacter anthyllidis TaxID=1035067 RepID=UPI00245741BD|nr:NAD-dependent epimerase/dehydratase family protein [Aminobacter anthyllidis]MDH4984421.1 NAD-dependent epimerase/dehydratase family protein [Aminobacter anthyllidis]